MSEEETVNETTVAINGISNLIKVVGDIAINCRNVKYDSSTNTTKYFGHSNFEEVKIYGKPVALKEDLNGLGTKEHTHKTTDISRDYEEEETVIEKVTDENGIETEQEVVKTVTKTITLDDVLDAKADVGHTHTMAEIVDYVEPTIDTSNLAQKEHTHSISEITNLDRTLLTKAPMVHNHFSNEIYFKMPASGFIEGDAETVETVLDDLKNNKSDAGHVHTMAEIVD